MCPGNKVDPIEIRSARGQRKKVNWRSYSHVERKMVLLTLYPQILNKASKETSISGLPLKWVVGEVLEYWPSTAVINKCWCEGLSLWEGLPLLAFAFCLGLSSPLCYWTNLLNSTHQLGCYLFQEALSDTPHPESGLGTPFVHSSTTLIILHFMFVSPALQSSCSFLYSQNWASFPAHGGCTVNNYWI